MENNSNKKLLGIIFLLLCFLTFSQTLYKINIGSLAFIFIGIAFILLYKTKRKSWSLIFGGYLTYFGICSFIGKIVQVNIGSYLFIPAFFIVPGIIFLILYFEKNKKGLLFPASMLIWFGIFLFANNFKIFFDVRFILFFICLGSSFVMIYVLGRAFVGNWCLYLGLILVIVGLIKITFLQMFNFNISIPTIFLPMFFLIMAFKFLFGKSK